jgi:hypothetical protein
LIVGIDVYKKERALMDNANYIGMDVHQGRGRATASPQRQTIPKRWATTQDLGLSWCPCTVAPFFGICRVGAILLDVGKYVDKTIFRV